MYLSTDSGESWVGAEAPAEFWQAVALSADGSNIVAVASGTRLAWGPGPIFTMHPPAPQPPPPPSPTVTISPAGGAFAVSWLIPSATFVLQQNSDLSTTNWTTVAPPPTLNFTNLHYEWTVSSPAGGRFYWLKQQ
jgi:hypothetical protein